MSAHIKLGSELSKEDQEGVKRAFINRFTKDHKPAWALGTKYRMQFDSDQDWLEHSYFKILPNGRWNPRSQHCISNPTWPDNPELRTPGLSRGTAAEVI